MNRKLLNGLLVLAVAAGGVGTFTSCKDEDFRNDVIVENAELRAQLAAIRNITDPVFYEKLKSLVDSWVEKCECGGGGGSTGESCTCSADKWLEWANQWTGEYASGWTYQDVVDATTAMDAVYQAIMSGDEERYSEAEKYVQGLYDFLFKNILQKEEWYNQIWTNQRLIENILQRASSVGVNQIINPVFGSINLPIGLKTTVLASYKYEGTAAAEYSFPTQVRDIQGGQSHLALDFDQYPEYVNALSTIAELAKGKAIALKNGSYTMGAGFGQMGAAYININPSSLDFEGSKNVQLVNSRDEVLLDAADGDLVVENNSEMLAFGYSRGEQTGVYKVNVNVCDKFEKNGGVLIDMDNLKEYVGDVKAAIKDKSISNIAYIGEQLYKRINNLLPAYSFKVWWNEKDANGNSVKNSVRSTYDVAAAVIHPLSYGTPLSEAFNGTIGDRRLPQFSPLRHYLEKIGNKLTIKIEGIETVDDIEVTFELTVGDDGYVYAYGSNGEVLGAFPYDMNGLNASPATLNDFVNAVADALGLELSDNINEHFVYELNKALATINDNLNAYNAKVADFLAMVEKNKIYDYASKLVDIYNTFAQKVNNVLSNPDHYLQVAAIYSDGEGHYHHLSTDANDPVRVFPKDGADAIEILATSYTGDVVVPSYAKYVAITAVNGKPATVADNTKAGSSLNTVLPGQVNRVPVKLSGFNKGDVLTLTYVSVDYHGLCSMQNYYVVVK